MKLELERFEMWPNRYVEGAEMEVHRDGVPAEERADFTDFALVVFAATSRQGRLAIRILVEREKKNVETILGEAKRRADEVWKSIIL